jgi:hypothetical protein
MIRHILLLLPLFSLTGCIGGLFLETNYGRDEYPDIRTVPEREEALKPRGQHEGEEAESRSAEFQRLQEDREKIKARNEALREGVFPNAQKAAEE